MLASMVLSTSNQMEAGNFDQNYDVCHHAVFMGTYRFSKERGYAGTVYNRIVLVLYGCGHQTLQAVRVKKILQARAAAISLITSKANIISSRVTSTCPA